MSAIEKELQALAKVKAGKDHQAYFKALVAGVQKVCEATNDEAWESLSEPSQAWVNEATRAVKDQKPIPDFPDSGDDPADNEENDVAPAKTGKGGAPAPKKTTSKPDPKKADPKKGAAPAKKASAPVKSDPKKDAPAARVAAPLKEDGIKYRIKLAILDNPKIGTEELCKLLSKGKDTASKVTVAAVRAEFRHTIKVLNAEKVTKIDI